MSTDPQILIAMLSVENCFPWNIELIPGAKKFGDHCLRISFSFIIIVVVVVYYFHALFLLWF